MRMLSTPLRSRRRRDAASRWLSALITVVVIAALTESTSTAARLGFAAHPTIGTDQGSPPAPVLLAPYLPQFMHLYAAYVALPPGKQPTFSEWLLMHGIVHPTTHRAMLLLYEWVQRQG